MAITPLPTPPTRQDPVNFADRADTFLAALPTFATEVNADLGVISDNFGDVQIVSDNIVNINAAVADLPALSAKVSKTGDTMTGHLEVPAGASGAQAVRASEAQWSGAVTVPMSGTAVDVSGIPLAAQEIAVVFQNVGIPATAGILLRIGNPAVSEVDYASISSAVTTGTGVGASLELTGVAIRAGSANASVVNGGMRILRLGSDNWFDGQFFGSDDLRMITVSGRKAMAGISVIRLRLSSGSFSGGSVLVRWRY